MSDSTTTGAAPAPGTLPASVHMIGIGGAGMSGVARLLLARGVTVSGSDMKDSRAVVGLRAMGATVAIGHDAANLDASGSLPEAVVVSFAAIPETNPELARARELGIPVLKRSDVLGMLLEGNRAVLIAGTHGKTSTTSMSVAALQAAGLDPSFAVGGLMSKAGVNAHHGTGDVFVAEADESDASLLTYSPQVAVVTNIEPDHLDFFGTAEKYYAVFDAFAGRIVDGGALVVCAEDEHAAALGERAKAAGIRVYAYGGPEALEAHPELEPGGVLHGWTAHGGGARVEATVLGDRITFELRQPGRHMALNALAALVSGALVDADPVRMARGLSEFTGVRRRFDYHGRIEGGQFAGVRVYDDYAHHPTEVRAVLGAARELVDEAGCGNVVAVFQPHLYSRTKAFAGEFAEALSLADKVIVLDVFGAREEPEPGVDGDLIARSVTVPTIFEPHFTSTPARVREVAGPDDVILTIGAGSVTMLADEILRELG
ncbi:MULTISPECIES: UDP-N-acetylmuramate--L-alanine ligase [Corynebacterium]|uniref:UDP-N-acetylmuramate--L-alanine ligase n=1 Tax=Corynebacterium freneyi TaxID=134034 RepID=A0ABS4U6H0_9CORY|nr:MULTISPECIES: UDP-N-acetylmuramate--L-alanine ligase [Corynebacterium]MBP2332251.1 UDP-N-acetylmuramate--alanine ligase [Corynebacterium freneyi]OFU58338.1 UDP-N-acetylmuramate--L-alanine ligase [Corynebacterium sp. HMSC11E11]QXA53538.1 UDP-N-acetylmuramate--L-alanine ligase [Corynebacterium freneyi]UBI01524.1 UDP-N-acetylmuramate--L-alanine ligase [Corynebacterium freneyi]WJZ05639.1 UDP-N-acetylmuramate--L-alanine ligase [Corynebacterium freneyi]